MKKNVAKSVKETKTVSESMSVKSVETQTPSVSVESVSETETPSVVSETQTPETESKTVSISPETVSVWIIQYKSMSEFKKDVPSLSKFHSVKESELRKLFRESLSQKQERDYLRSLESLNYKNTLKDGFKRIQETESVDGENNRIIERLKRDGLTPETVVSLWYDFVDSESLRPLRLTKCLETVSLSETETVSYYVYRWSLKPIQDGEKQDKGEIAISVLRHCLKNISKEIKRDSGLSLKSGAAWSNKRTVGECVSVYTVKEDGDKGEKLSEIPSEIVRIKDMSLE